MIKIENTEVLGWEAAIRGCRNPMNSWEKSDSIFYHPFEQIGHDINENTYGNDDGDRDYPEWFDWKKFNNDYELAKTAFQLGPNDHKLMMNLAKAGSVDAKYRRMIVVYADITAPLYWWKEFDTYKVSTVANSCSTMHKIHSKEFDMNDFSFEHLFDQQDDEYALIHGLPFANKEDPVCPKMLMWELIKMLNFYREKFLETKDKRYWWQMIQLLPSSYNQRRTIMLNYEVLAGIYPKRKDHKLDEWHTYCDWIKSLPYLEIITLEEKT